MRRILSYCLVLFAAVAFCACNEKVDDLGRVNPTAPATYSSKCQMTKLFVQLAQDPAYAEADYFVLCNQKGTQFSALNQKQVPLNSVVVKFEISNKAKLMEISADGAVLQDSLISTVSTLDLSKTVYLKVLAQDKEHANIYTLDVASY